MKSLSFTAIFLAFALAGCTDIWDPVSSSDNGPVIRTGPTDGRVFHAVTGSVYWQNLQATIPTKTQFTFSARQFADGSASGEFECRDNGPEPKGSGKIYDVKVSGNVAKIAFYFTGGDAQTLCMYSSDIRKMYGWLVVIDNGEGGAAEPDYGSMALVTDGSDLGDVTIPDIDKMEAPQFLEWMRTTLLPSYRIAYAEYFAPCNDNSVRIE